MKIRILRGHEVNDAVCLIMKTFDAIIAQHYSSEGVTFFKANHQSKDILQSMKDGHLIGLGAFEDDALIGVAFLKDMQHLAALYVDPCYHHQGIGSQLLKKVKNLVYGPLTVNAYPGAFHFYQKNGFEQTGDIQECHGIVSIPMVYHSENVHQFETYDQVHAFIASQKNRVYALDNFKNFMNDFCNPQILLKTVHIGGTNGKGSSTNYVRSVLQKEGYKVATFTSPVLITRLEIMRINNQPIAEKDIIQYANRYMSVWLQYELSMFEIEVFIAIMYFIKQRVDFAIFEVGLGGELDATNIVYPIIACNTNIGLDHVEYLGDTYEKIAYTKGGIIKDHVPFITGEKKKECLAVFKQLCLEHESPFLQVKDILNVQQNQGQVSYDYLNYHIVLNTPATYQCENSALALEILLYLRNNGFITLSDDHLLLGLKEAVWEGRFETICQNPLIIIDGAHNKEGMMAFYQSAQQYSHIKVIFSALKDKDTHAMMELLLKLTDDITVCEFDFYRAQSAEKLAENFPVKIEKDWKKAIDDSFQHQGVVFVTGSLYFISQVRPYLIQQTKKHL